MANTTVPVIGPQIFITTGTTIQTVTAAVNAQVDVLQQSYIHTPFAQPGSTGATTSGNVVYGSIAIDPVQVGIIEGLQNYTVSVRWQAMIIPT